ncbi:nicotinamide riboside transporter PnuC [Oerskovia sp. Root22]|uniref:nicotinamide riboside transporter PnuC n=1 Tax=Oerskovia sp. Root22 TaxID=1736494 RepID=UPI0009E777E1|nr:nicotinamide riboside transporter PnuC [Oerskovia sp. Root22]
MSIEEIIGFVTGALCVWLAVRQNVWTFPIGLANNAVYVILFASTGLYAGAGLQVVYLVLGALGWYWWVRGGEAHRALTVRRTPAWVWPAAAVGAAAATALLVWVLSTWTDSTVPFWDALTTSTSLVAQLMLGRKWVGSWWVWIVTDVMLVGLYASQGLWLTAVLYVGFIGLCALGLRDWSAELRAGTHTSAGTPTEPDGPVPAVQQDAR